ncbi:MAG TPA: adenosylcobinamide-phosphate synthase CbiB [Candidatus Baltobacteraceae bacterium]|nr:adenosylcobinamide-phosphate synthase CbiB [Candidatus Baltobacteraceae bacterium]
MRLEYQLAIAFGLDLVLGDPRWLPHPVKVVGRFAAGLERPLRGLVPSARWAGMLTVTTVLGATGTATWLVLQMATRMHPLAGDVAAILLLWTCLAARDLIDHSGRVRRALAGGDLVEARRRVGMMVGRDTDALSEPEVVRATVESVAENLVDGVTAPLFFAVLGGPVGAMLYKAANTLDSTFGYKNERWIEFGWASARFDDLVNWLPARLTAPLVPMAAALLGLRPVQAARIARRDSLKHPSPNAGLAEAAVAGALGVQLGGRNYYFGRASERPRLGDPLQTLAPRHIGEANRLMLTTSCLALLVFAGLRMLIQGLWV